MNKMMRAKEINTGSVVSFILPELWNWSLRSCHLFPPFYVGSWNLTLEGPLFSLRVF